MSEDFGFRRRYTPTIMSGPVIRWDLGPGSEVNASRFGVGISGSAFLTNRDEVRDFIGVLQLALRVRAQLGEGIEPDALTFSEESK